ncbi:hypothetical protein ACTVMJ_16480, partial [Serratia marcescens]
LTRQGAFTAAAGADDVNFHHSPIKSGVNSLTLSASITAINLNRLEINTPITKQIFSRTRMPAKNKITGVNIH